MTPGAIGPILSNRSDSSIPTAKMAQLLTAIDRTRPESLHPTQDLQDDLRLGLGSDRNRRRLLIPLGLPAGLGSHYAPIWIRGRTSGRSRHSGQTAMRGFGVSSF